MDNTQAETVSRAISLQVPGSVEWQVLMAMRDLAQTAPTKWLAYLDKATVDGLLLGAFQMLGAGRTGRWASRGINLQNLKTPGKNFSQEDGVRAIMSGDLWGIEGVSPVDILGGTVRAGICAPNGHALDVCDWSSIESRIVGWLTGCDAINSVFRSGRDTYKAFASELYSIPYSRVTDAQRKFSKPPVLGCAYMLSGNGLVDYASGMGVEMGREDAFTAVNAWRSLHPEVVNFWDWITSAVFRALRVGKTVAGHGLSISRVGAFLTIRLPSDRSICYFHPGIVQKEIRWTSRGGEERSKIIDAFEYYGINRHNNQWGRITAHAGGLLENIVQAISRDILADGLENAEKAGLDVRGHVHDEIIVISREGESRLDELRECMIRPAEWRDGLLLDASGYSAKRYRKD